MLTSKLPRFYDGKTIIIMELKSKELANFVSKYLSWENKKTKTIRLRNREFLKNKEFLIGFLRGLIDSDGYVRKERKEIYFGTVSKELSNDFIKALDELNLIYKTYIQKRKGCSDFHKVRIADNEVSKFCKKIRPIKWTDRDNYH